MRAGAGIAPPPSPAVPASAPPPAADRPLGGAAFLGVAITSLGGPLALAALYAPGLVDDVTGSAGLVTLVGSAAFAVPLLVWLRYSRVVAGSGGLYDFVAASAGRRIALAQAGLWIFSYALYLLYTTAAIVYETLPTVLPWIRPYRPVLEIGIPVLLAAIMLGGRALTLAVLGVLAIGQLALMAALATVTIGHDAPTGSFIAADSASDLSSAGGQVALLYVCGSLPLFLGGELSRPHRTIRRGLIASYLLVAAGVVATVFPLAANPAFSQAAIPGMAEAQVFSGRGLAVAVGIGVAVSVGGVMLVEYLALTRLLHAVTGRSTRQLVVVLGVVLALSGPITLIDPKRIYDDLLKPSLAALWLSQLVVFLCYPRFAARLHGVRVSDIALGGAASLFAAYGLYMTFHGSSS